MAERQPQSNASYFLLRSGEQNQSITLAQIGASTPESPAYFSEIGNPAVSSEEMIITPLLAGRMHFE